MTRDQVYSARAWQRVNQWMRLDEETRKKEVGFAKSFPAMILGCGLCQAVTFAHSKGHENFLTALSFVLTPTGESVPNPEQLIGRIQDAQLTGYIRLSREAIVAAGWIKRFCEALDPDTIPGGD